MATATRRAVGKDRAEVLEPTEDRRRGRRAFVLEGSIRRPELLPPPGPASSPLLWPTTASGPELQAWSRVGKDRPLGREDDVHPDTLPTRLRDRRSVRGLRTGVRSAMSLAPDSLAIRSEVSKRVRTSGKCGQRSASMPGYCDPSPGNMNARLRSRSLRADPRSKRHSGIADRSARWVRAASRTARLRVDSAQIFE